MIKRKAGVGDKASRDDVFRVIAYVRADNVGHESAQRNAQHARAPVAVSRRAGGGGARQRALRCDARGRLSGTS